MCRWCVPAVLLTLLIQTAALAGPAETGCDNPTPEQRPHPAQARWESGPVLMQWFGTHTDLPPGLQAYNTYKWQWGVPGEWNDGLRVEFEHLDSVAPPIILELPKPFYFASAGTWRAFYVDWPVLEAPGCWRVTVAHGTERYLFDVVAEGPAEPPFISRAEALAHVAEGMELGSGAVLEAAVGRGRIVHNQPPSVTTRAACSVP